MKKLLILLLLALSFNVNATYTKYLEKGNVLILQNKSNVFVKYRVHYLDYILAPKMIKYIQNHDDGEHDVDIGDKYLNFMEGGTLSKKLYKSPNIINIAYDCGCGDVSANKNGQEIITNKYHPEIITITNYTIKDLIELNNKNKTDNENFYKTFKFIGKFLFILLGVAIGFIVIKNLFKAIKTTINTTKKTKTKIYEDKNYKI